MRFVLSKFMRIRECRIWGVFFSSRFSLHPSMYPPFGLFRNFSKLWKLEGESAVLVNNIQHTPIASNMILPYFDNSDDPQNLYAHAQLAYDEE